MSDNALTVKQVAEYLNVNERTVYRMAQHRDLPAFKVAGTWRVLASDLEDWVRRKKEQRMPITHDRDTR